MPLQHAEGFVRHPEQTGVDYAWGIPGNRGALAHQENQGERVYFFLTTYQQDLAAVKAFAGGDYHIAVTYPDDDIFELLPDPYAFQHEVEVVLPLQADDRASGGSTNNRRLLVT